jgi:glycosyltransferase involved in cell wall biosynthesis
MTNSLVSVIIPNYNYAHFLREAIDSVLAQTYSNIEIIVVDDGSTDGSREVIESYGNQIRAVFQQNKGVSAARNNGVKAGDGEYIAFLDADDIWLPEKIEKQAKEFEAAKNLGLVHTGVIDIDISGKRLVSQMNGRSGRVSRELLQFDGPVVLGGGSGIMIRRSTFEKIDGFDPRMSTSADWDLFYRASCVCEFGFVPEILVEYRIHGSNMHSDVKAMEHDVLIGLKRAFTDRKLVRLRRDSYSRFFAMLAGSYFRAGKYLDLVRTGFWSFCYGPSIFISRLASIGDKSRKQRN